MSNHQLTNTKWPTYSLGWWPWQERLELASAGDSDPDESNGNFARRVGRLGPYWVELSVSDPKQGEIDALIKSLRLGEPDCTLGVDHGGNAANLPFKRVSAKNWAGYVAGADRCPVHVSFTVEVSDCSRTVNHHRGIGGFVVRSPIAKLQLLHPDSGEVLATLKPEYNDPNDGSGISIGMVKYRNVLPGRTVRVVGFDEFGKRVTTNSLFLPCERDCPFEAGSRSRAPDATATVRWGGDVEFSIEVWLERKVVDIGMLGDIEFDGDTVGTTDAVCALVGGPGSDAELSRAHCFVESAISKDFATMVTVSMDGISVPGLIVGQGVEAVRFTPKNRDPIVVPTAPIDGSFSTSLRVAWPSATYGVMNCETLDDKGRLIANVPC